MIPRRIATRPWSGVRSQQTLARHQGSRSSRYTRVRRRRSAACDRPLGRTQRHDADCRTAREADHAGCIWCGWQPLAALRQKASRRPVASYVVVDGSIRKPGAADWPDAPVTIIATRMRPAASRHARPSCVAGRLSRPTTLQWHFARSSPTHSRRGEADRPAGSIAGASARKPPSCWGYLREFRPGNPNTKGFGKRHRLRLLGFDRTHGRDSSDK